MVVESTRGYDSTIREEERDLWEKNPLFPLVSLISHIFSTTYLE
jgi:hypothetical protein